MSVTDGVPLAIPILVGNWHTQAPTAVVYHHPATSSFTLASIKWPLCDAPTTDTTCAASEPFANGFSGIEAKTVCEGAFVISDDHSFGDAFAIEADNGTFCNSENILLDISGGGSFQSCHVEG